MKKGLLLLFVLGSFHFSFSQYRATSVLANGDWYKIAVSQSGIHKIDYKFLKSIGIDPDKTDPRNIQIFGNGGGMLPQNNSTSRIDDLAENAIYIKGEDDGKFDTGDYILFYAQGPDTWTYSTVNSVFTHNKNIYSDNAYYFITAGNVSGKRVANDTTACDANSAVIISTFDDHYLYEKDLVNMINSGRDWFGDQFDGTSSLNFPFNIPGIVSGTNLILSTNVAVKPTQSSYTNFGFNYAVNSQSLGNVNVTGSPQGCEQCYQKANASSKIFTVNVDQLGNTSTINVSIFFNKSQDPSASGYLDFLELNAKCNLALNGSQTAFRSIESKNQPFVNFTIANRSSTSVLWDITTITSPFNKPTSCVATSGQIRELVVFEPDQVSLTPSFVNKVANQNLHAMASPSMIIVAHPSLLEEADRLAAFRVQQGITVEVVTTEQIYNEFSSGAQDITAIRDFCRMLYKKGNLKNLLLFGSCSFDYKNRIGNNTNLVPCYESRESLHQIYSMSSEDYYAFYGDNEGDWLENESSAYNYLMKIGVGRIPVRNPDEASAVVNKLIHYASEKSFGKWRNRIVFMADNGDYDLHVDSADKLADQVDNSNVNLNVNKIYIDAFPLISTPSGNKVPAANEAIRNAINQGVLIANYTGHGGVYQLAQEIIINVASIRSWTNIDKLPFFVMATCDFSTYDDPSIISGGITILTQSEGGGIGLISATRPVYSSTNEKLNNAFYGSAFTPDSMGNMPDLGTVIKGTKNNSVSGRNNRSYALLTDPSMKLAYPLHEAVVTKITNLSSEQSSDTIKALSVISIEGEIHLHGSTVTATNFNGILYCDIYDKYTNLLTLGQASNTPSPVYAYKLQNSQLYSGTATVKNGKYSLSFVVPKDINYQLGEGKISLYAYDSYNKVDAAGYNRDIIIGGSNPFVSDDSIPPAINLYMNDTTFSQGNVTGNRPVLIAKLYDANGINIARSAIGHEITFYLDEDQNNKSVLNDYYTSVLNSYTDGKVVYPLDSLAEGPHTLTFKAWDTHNNSASVTLDFVVASSRQIAMNQLINYPNPVSDNTVFRFNHNRAGEDITVNIQVFDRMGRIIKVIDQDLPQSNATIEIPWNIKDETSYNMYAGLYVYKCTVVSRQDGSQTQAFQKLVLTY